MPQVFYVTSHGSAGDHWFDWFARSLNAHPDLMIYMGESVRSKYLRERARNERPDILAFTQFLFDLGKPYPAIGECYAYRSYQLGPVRQAYGDDVRAVNVVRHPYCWLSSYVRWRTENMGMPPDQRSGVDHEWSVTRHEEFRALGLHPYTREDIGIWASHQGMHILNRMVSDDAEYPRNVRLEALVEDTEVFTETVSYLTHGEIAFTQPLLRTISDWRDTPFRPGGRVLADPFQERAAWPPWKAEAFDRLVGESARSTFEKHGYAL